MVAVSAESCSAPGLQFQESSSIPESNVRKSRALHARFGRTVESIAASRRRSQNAQGNLSRCQKRRFLIAEKGSPVTLNASLAGMIFDPVSDRRRHSVPLNLRG